MKHDMIPGALSLALLFASTLPSGLVAQEVRAVDASDTQAPTPSKVLSQVRGVLRKALSKVERPTRGASKAVRAAYTKAYQNARQAQESAAKQALTQHAALLAKPSASKQRAELQSLAGQNAEAMKSYLAFAEATDSPAERSSALVLAASLCRRYGDGALAAKKILAKVDASQLNAQMQRTHKSLASGLDSDIKREKLHGQQAPNIAALHVLGGSEKQTGDEFALSNYKGKVVLVDFWATWCGPCRVVIPSLVEMQEKYGDKIQVLGVTRFYGSGSDFSDPESALPHGGKPVRDLDEEAELEINRAFAKRFSLNYPIVVSDRKAGQSYAVRGIPTIFVIDQNGKIANSVVGSGEANHAKVVRSVEKLLGIQGDAHGDAQEASGQKQAKRD